MALGCPEFIQGIDPGNLFFISADLFEKPQIQHEDSLRLTPAKLNSGKSEIMIL